MPRNFIFVALATLRGITSSRRRRFFLLVVDKCASTTLPSNAPASFEQANAVERKPCVLCSPPGPVS